MTRKRKILLGGAGVLAALALLPALLAGLDLWRASRRVAEFTRRHADAPRQAEAVALRISRALSGHGEGVTTANAPGAAAPPSSLRRRDIYPVCEEYDKVEAAYIEAYDSSFYQWLERASTISLFLPAGDFMDRPSDSTRLGDLPALRRRIRSEVEAQLTAINAKRPVQELKPMPRDALTSGPLAARLAKSLDRTAEILTDDWDDLIISQQMFRTIFTYRAIIIFGWMSRLTVEREASRGNPRPALRMLEGMIRAAACLRFNPDSVACPPDFEILQTILKLARRGTLDEAALARLERLLAGSRLSDAELANLRAAVALERMKRFQEKQAYYQSLNKRQSLEDKVLLRTTGKWGDLDFLAMMAAWGTGDPEASDMALAHHRVLTDLLPKFPNDYLAVRGVPMTNEALDLNRLIVAAERYRLAHGEYPAALASLRPAYLDATFDARPDAFWAVDRVTVKGKDGAPAQRPVFYHARRTPFNLTRLEAQKSELGSNGVDQIGLQKEKSHPWLHALGQDGFGFYLDLWSNDYVDTVVVKAVCPPLEEGYLKW